MNLAKWIDCKVNSFCPVWPLAVCRLLYGSLMALTYIDFYFSSLPMFPFHNAAPALEKTELYPLFKFSGPFLMRNGSEDIWTLLTVALAMLFALGWRIRWTGTALVFFHLSFRAINPAAFWGWAELIAPLLLYLAWSNADKTCSIDRNGARRSFTLPDTFVTRVLQLHITFQYVSCSIPRLENDLWLSGLQVSGLLESSMHGRFHTDFQFDYPFLLSLLNFSIFLIELLGPILLFFRSTRAFGLAALICLHLGLLFFTNLPGWQLFMIGGLATFLGSFQMNRFREVFTPPTMISRPITSLNSNRQGHVQKTHDQ